MKALRYYGPGDIRVEETSIPDLNVGEVKVKVVSAGICATDVKTFLRGHPKIQPGSVIGHEISGIITEVNQVDDWAVGDRLAVAPYVPCLECLQCQRKCFTTCERLMEETIDPGGFCEFVRVPPRIVSQGLVHLPDDLPYSLGSLAEPIACCIHGLEVLHLQPDDNFLVIGDGAMGLFQVLLARKMGVKKTILCGLIPERLAIAREMADIVIDARQENFAEKINNVTHGGADKVIISVGDAQVVESSIRFVQKGGILNIFGGTPKGQSLSLDPNRIHYDEISITGSFGFTPQHFRQAVDQIVPLREKIEKIISGIVTLDNVSSAMKDMIGYRGIKYLVEFP